MIATFTAFESAYTMTTATLFLIMVGVGLAWWLHNLIFGDKDDDR